VWACGYHGHSHECQPKVHVEVEATVTRGELVL
jgi:hypothetical protein